MNRVRADRNEIPWERYGQRINYTTCNEHSQSEIDALNLDKGSRVLAITAGGGRILDLLACGPSEIVAVDVNPLQNFLLELKIAAMRAFDLVEFQQFLGVRPWSCRDEQFRALRDALSDGARSYFDAHPQLIRDGILYQGRHERFYVALSRMIQWTRQKDLLGLFDFYDLDEQRRYIEKTWKSKSLQLFLRNIGRRKFVEVVGDDPGFLRFIPADVPVHERIYESLTRYFWNNVVRENHTFSIMFFGRYVYEPALPLYLRNDSFDEIKRSLESATMNIVTGPLQDVLRDMPARHFDGYSISDVPSYLSRGPYEAMFGDIIRTAKEGARLSARGCLASPPVPQKHATMIVRDRALEERLSLHDYAVVHDFLVGQIAHSEGNYNGS